MSSSLHCLTHPWSNHSPNYANLWILCYYSTFIQWEKYMRTISTTFFSFNPDHMFETIFSAELLFILFCPPLNYHFYLLAFMWCQHFTHKVGKNIYSFCCIILLPVAADGFRPFPFRGVWEQIQTSLKAQLSSAEQIALLVDNGSYLWMHVRINQY